MQSLSITPKAVNQLFFFKTWSLWCTRIVPQSLMFLILLDGPHMQSWTSAHSLSTFQPPCTLVLREASRRLKRRQGMCWCPTLHVRSIKQYYKNVRHWGTAQGHQSGPLSEIRHASKMYQGIIIEDVFTKITTHCGNWSPLIFSKLAGLVLFKPSTKITLLIQQITSAFLISSFTQKSVYHLLPAFPLCTPVSMCKWERPVMEANSILQQIELTPHDHELWGTCFSTKLISVQAPTRIRRILSLGFINNKRFTTNVRDWKRNT